MTSDNQLSSSVTSMSPVILILLYKLRWRVYLKPDLVNGQLLSLGRTPKISENRSGFFIDTSSFMF